MSIPRLSHLQFLIMGFLQSGTVRGKDLRGALSRAGERRSGPGFYQLMARLEDQGFVRGRYEQAVIEGQIIRERLYEPTAQGGRAWHVSREFYSQWILQFDDGTASA